MSKQISDSVRIYAAMQKLKTTFETINGGIVVQASTSGKVFIDDAELQAMQETLDALDARAQVTDDMHTSAYIALKSYLDRCESIEQIREHAMLLCLDVLQSAMNTQLRN